MNEPTWIKLWRCPYCQNVISDSVMLPLTSIEYTNEGMIEGSSDYMTCPCCNNSVNVPEE